MCKYDALWTYIQKDGSPALKLTFAQIQEIAGVPIDHSGYQVGKISMKEPTVIFQKTV